MKNIVYFRVLYEYEKQHDNIQIIKNYIHGKNANILSDFCSGKLNIPSPLLLDEIEWGLNGSDNNRINEIMYQLKAMSRQFYTSLMECASGTYHKHFANTSTTLGQNIICYLIELRLCNTGSHYNLINKGKIFLYKIFLFATHYPRFIARLHGVYSIFSLTIFWGICITIDLTTPFITFFFGIMICTFAIMGAFSLKNKINIFQDSTASGKNLLVIRYKEFFNMLEHDGLHTPSPRQLRKK